MTIKCCRRERNKVTLLTIAVDLRQRLHFDHLTVEQIRSEMRFFGMLAGLGTLSDAEIDSALSTTGPYPALAQ